MAEHNHVKNNLFRSKNTIFRILTSETERCLCVDCLKQTMPRWLPASEVVEGTPCSEEDLWETASVTVRPTEVLSAEEKRVAHERYTLVAGVLPFVGSVKMRSYLLSEISEENRISKKTVSNYLCRYLSFQDISVLAPKSKVTERKLTKDQKNIRWALNKFYYTRHGNTLAEAYTMMLKAKYCDEVGSLLPNHPSIHQFRYFYRNHRSTQKSYISRDGLKDYQMNHRPLLGDGVRQYAPAVGVGMLDGTICDIYLVDEAGNLVGRPLLTACVDAYSGLCCGYSLTWEGGMYALRDMLLNSITNKVEWCKQYGILIEKQDWDCSQLMGTYVTDKGSEYASFNFEQLTELGCKVENLPAFRAELKGPVEKFFDLIQDLYKPYLQGKGVVEPDFQKRGAHDYRLDACLTMRQFEQIVLRCILYYNNERIVENFPYTDEMLEAQVAPHAENIWEHGKRQIGANLITVTREQLVLTLLPRTEGRFARNGLRVNKLRYGAEGFVEQFLAGGTVTVAYNPDNVSCVWLLQDGEYIRFDLIESRFEGKALSEVQSVQKRQKDIITADTEANTRAKVELAQHIEAIANQAHRYADTNIKGITLSRQRQKEQRHRDFARGLTEQEETHD